MTNYAIRRIDPLSAFKYGLSIGALIMLPTGLLVGIFARWLVGVIRVWMESWGTLEVQGLLGVGLEINLLNIVELTNFLEIVRGLDDMGFLFVLAVIFMMVVFGGVFIGFLSVLGAWAYNLGAAGSGGIIVNAEILDAPAFASGRMNDRAEYDQGLPAQGISSGRQAAHTGHDQEPNRRLAASPPRPLPSPHRPMASPPPAIAPAPNRKGAWLVSSHDGRRYPIKADSTTIGSAPNNDLVLPGLAAHHAEIRLQERRYVLYDRGSNQILVNERAIMGPNMLKDGFRVRLGTVDFVFKEEV